MKSYTLTVTGWTWGGFESEHTYNLTKAQAESVKTLADAKKFCGDFESIDSMEVTQVETIAKFTYLASDGVRV